MTYVLYPYTKNQQIFRCPSDQEYFKTEYASYLWNWMLEGQSIDFAEFFGIDLLQYPCMIDAKNKWHGGDDDEDDPDFKRNGVWLDGHAKFMTKTPENLPF